MRFLVVYQDFFSSIQDLVDELDVEDVTVLSFKKGEQVANAEFLAVLREHPGAPVAICQVNRKFKRSIDSLVDIQHVTKKFRSDDQRLIDWIRPSNIIKEPRLKPSQALVDASMREEHLVIADRALDFADKIPPHRWKFANHSADLLARYANGENLGPLRNWKESHGVDFAANGGVRYQYRLIVNGMKTDGSSEWHLKEGDKTTRESAVRIYFDRIQVGGVTKVCIFYAGPHPEAKSYSVQITCT